MKEVIKSIRYFFRLFKNFACEKFKCNTHEAKIIKTITKLKKSMHGAQDMLCAQSEINENVHSDMQLFEISTEKIS